MYKKLKKFSYVLLGLIFLACLLVPHETQAETNVESARSSVFRLAVCDENGEVVSFGSAFYVGRIGDSPALLTNYHVISRNTDGVYIWMNDKTEIRCVVVASLEDTDLALLKPEEGTLPNSSPLAIGRAEDVSVGDTVYALGFPTADISNTMSSYAEDVSVTRGCVSKKSTWLGVSYYQIDAAINAGNSGGPLLHESGKVIGICTMKMEQTEGIGGAIVIQEAETLLQENGVVLPEETQQPSVSPSPIHVQTPIPVTTLSPGEVAAAQQTYPAPRRSTSGLWIGVFVIAAVLFAVLLLFLFFRQRKSGRPVLQMPALRRVRGYVVGKSGAYAGAVISLSEETVFFGRDPEKCQMVFDASQNQISRVHCSLRFDEQTNRFLIENYSKNGTFLGDGRPVESGRPAELGSGDSFCLGDDRNLFEVYDKKSAPLPLRTKGV